MQMTHQNILRKLSIIVLTLLTHTACIACSCMDSVTLENALRKSNIVIKGRAIEMDTVGVFDSFIYAKNGIRVGKEKLLEKRHLRIRYKVLVDTVYKSSYLLKDTIYILTGFLGGFDCGMPLIIDMPMLISADNYIEKEIIVVKKENKIRRQLKTNVSKNIFNTSTCHYTRYFTSEIHEKLKKLSP